MELHAVVIIVLFGAALCISGTYSSSTPEPTGMTAESESTSEPEITPEYTPEPEGEISLDLVSTTESANEEIAENEPVSEPETTTEPEPEGASTEPESMSEPESTSESEPESEQDVSPEETAESEMNTEPEAELLPEDTTESEPNAEGPLGSASVSEILLPPFILFVLGIAGLAILYTLYHKRKVKAFFCGSKQTKTQTSANRYTTDKLLTERDMCIMENLLDFQSNFQALIILSTPALLSLVFCPAALFLHKPIVDFLWPPDLFPVLPDTNSPISCFLVPSGMVYAISFGFAFQEAVVKFQVLDDNIATKVSTTRQLLSLVSLLPGLNTNRKIKILRILKSEIINKILQVQEQFSEMKEVDVWEILKELRHNKSTMDQNLELVVYTEIMRCLRQLHNLSAVPEPIHKRIPIVQWVLLEALSYFTFLGVLLIQADSYRMELAMCIVTVVSITLLCYAVSDVDSPFHGLFRIDLERLPDTAELIGKTAEELKLEDEQQLLL